MRLDLLESFLDKYQKHDEKYNDFIGIFELKNTKKV